MKEESFLRVYCVEENRPAARSLVTGLLNTKNRLICGTPPSSGKARLYGRFQGKITLKWWCFCSLVFALIRMKPWVLLSRLLSVLGLRNVFRYALSVDV